MLGAPCSEVAQRPRVGGRIQAKNRAALLHLVRHEVLERGHLDGLIGQLVGEMSGKHDHAFCITDDDVTRKYRGVASADRHVDVDRLMKRQVSGWGGPMMVGGNRKLRDLCRVAEASVGHDAGNPALHETRHEYGSR